jgi:putative ABC transport system permease protein
MPKSDRGRAFAEREQNLSFSADLPPDNELVEGQWWSTSSGLQPAVSVATEFRDELNLHLGDRLVFDVGGDMIEATIQSFRKVRWDGFRPNFFLLFSPGVLDASVGSFLAATHLDEEGRRALPEFDHQFPTVTVLDIDGVLNSVRALIDRAAAAITYVFAFTLVAGLVVLLAAVRATADERRYEIAVLRAFGASRRQIVSGGMAEFAILGALSGGVAAIASSAIGVFIASHWLGVPWRPTGSIWFWGVCAGAFGVTLFGTASTWRMSTTRPARVLRGHNS